MCLRISPMHHTATCVPATVGQNGKRPLQDEVFVWGGETWRRRHPCARQGTWLADSHMVRWLTGIEAAMSLPSVALNDKHYAKATHAHTQV